MVPKPPLVAFASTVRSRSTLVAALVVVVVVAAAAAVLDVLGGLEPFPRHGAA